MNQLAFKAMCKMHAQKGVTMIEYVLIAALIAIVAIATIGLVGDEMILIWNDILTAIQNR